MRSVLVVLLLSVVSGVNAGAASPDAVPRVESPRIRETLPAQSVSSAYLTIINPSDEDLVLTGVDSAQVPRIEIHEHRHENGMMQMRKRDSVTVPAHGKRVFESGGLHLMLMNLPRPLQVGEVIGLTLHFTRGNATGEAGFPVEVTAVVKSVQDTLQAPDGGHAHHAH